MSPRQKGASAPMTDEHKAALAEGRAHGRAVRNYLEALEANRPKRGRKRTPDSIKKRLEAIETALSASDPLTRVSLIQERLDLTAELDAKSAPAVDMAELEKGFVAVAAEYSRRRGISYAAWREAGLDPVVLKQAGITR
ncbi:MAG TPA: hypothetical protein VNB24_10105 [Acidimicrobiales bacterium]|nr:hypothetical protein [Acidimicrobiales bacterium]